ncbi:MAG: hypothetical protein WC875_03020 [Candidatus Absconditabacterales bacterium]|jgi:hypothetical protein
MEKKLELKIKAFEYIVYRLAQWHTAVIPPWRFFIPEPLSKTKNLSLLFIVCLASKDEDKPAMFSLFDNFVTFLHEGVIEKDIWDNYDKIILSKELPDAYEGIPYDVIDYAIAHLKFLNKNIIHHLERKRIEFTKSHLSWMIFMDHGEGTKIPTEILIQERSVYARGEKTLIFG